MLSFIRKLLKIVTRLKAGAQTAVSVPFETTCECGATVSGMRRASWIEAECQSCCQSVFILPANVYPSTKRVSSTVLSGSFLTRLKVVVGEVFPKKERPQEVEVDPVTAAEAAYADAAAKRPAVSWPVFDIFGLLRRTFTPFRLLMISVLAVIGLTGYWMIHERAVEAARQTWLQSSDEVQTLLQERKLTSLESVLSEAVDAGRVLGKDDSEWRLLRNLLDETRAVNNISDGDLLSAFHNAYDIRPRLVDGAEEIVRQATTSGNFVFESWLHNNSEDSDSILLDLPATPGQHSVEVLIPLPAIAELLESIEDGHVLFAASIDTVSAPGGGSDNSWHLTIAPASFVVITSDVHCEELGLPVESDAELKNLVERQKEFVASSSTWEHRMETIVQSENTTEVEGATQ